MQAFGTRSAGSICSLVVAGGCAVAAMAAVGCGEASAQPTVARATSSEADVGAALLGHVGKNVKVHLKRDALGIANTSGVGPLVDSFNGAELSLGGKLLGIDEEWVRIERQRLVPPVHENGQMVRGYTVISNGEIFVPRDVVLVITVMAD